MRLVALIMILVPLFLPATAGANRKPGRVVLLRGNNTLNNQTITLTTYLPPNYPRHVSKYNYGVLNYTIAKTYGLRRLTNVSSVFKNHRDKCFVCVITLFTS